MPLAIETITSFAFILARMSGCVLFNPIFARRNVPDIAKLALIMSLSAFMYLTVPFSSPPINTTIEYMVVMIKELAIGFVLGYIMSLFAYVIILGGEMIDFQIGIAMAKIFDPQTNMQISLSAGFYNVAYMMLFLGINGHAALIRLFINSAKIVPFGNVVIGQNVAQLVLDIFCDTTVLAVKFSLPIVAIGIMIEAGVGVLMKVIPQINIFMLNIQIKLLTGILGMVILFYPLADFLEKIIVEMFDALQLSISLMVK